MPCRELPSAEDNAWRQLDLDAKNTLPRRDHVARDQPDPVHSIVIHKRAVGAAQVAQLTLRRIDLNHEVIARESHVLRHRTMHEPRPPHDEGVVALEDERAAL